MVCSNPKFGTGHIFSRPWPMATKKKDFNTSYERSFYKLSEKHKLTLLDNGTKVIAVQRLTLCRRSP